MRKWRVADHGYTGLPAREQARRPDAGQQSAEQGRHQNAGHAHRCPAIGAVAVRGSGWTGWRGGDFQDVLSARSRAAWVSSFRRLMVFSPRDLLTPGILTGASVLAAPAAERARRRSQRRA